jgi:hypothetical protein
MSAVALYLWFRIGREQELGQVPPERPTEGSADRQSGT